MAVNRFQQLFAAVPIQNGIIRHITRADYIPLLQAIGPIARIGRRVQRLFWGPSCAERIGAPPNVRVCGQRARQNLRVRRCDGHHEYPNFNPANPQQSVPAMTPQGTWPAPIRQPHNIQPFGRFLCWNCRTSIRRVRKPIIRGLAQSQHHLNLCVGHCKAPPATSRCQCGKICHNGRHGWTCTDCSIRTWQRLLSPRARQWRHILRHTHQEIRRTRRGVKNRTLRTFVDFNRPRMGYVCPVLGCGWPSATDHAVGRPTYRMCLCCCAVF